MPFTRTRAASPQVLMVMPADPWSEWTMSGISRALCLELQQRGALWGAVDPNNLHRGSLQGPSPLAPLHRLVRKLKDKLGVPKPKRWTEESEGNMGAFLRACPSKTNVVYAFHSPEVDTTLDVRRFRFMDLSLVDAFKFGSYGYAEMPKESYDSLYQNQYRTIHAATGILTLSSYAADSIARDFKYDRSNIYPIGAGAAVSFSKPPSLATERYKKGEVLFVGRDWLRKGGPLLLEAFAIVKQAVPHATLTIVGPDINPAPSQAGINFVGFLAKDDEAQRERLQSLFLESSVFCMPSVCETWGLVYSEAAMAGLPIAGFREWALPDVVEDGRSGLLSDQRSPEALAESLIRLLSDPAMAASFGREGIRYVSEVLNWSAVADRLLYAVSEDRSALAQPAWLAGDLERVNAPRDR